MKARFLPVVAAAILTMLGWVGAAVAEPLTAAEIAPMVEPPYELGERLSEEGIWTIRDRTGVEAGFIFETGQLAPLPGFSGAPIELVVTIDSEGRFLRAEILNQHEPVFVSGLGAAPFHEFMRQYRGLSIFDRFSTGDQSFRTSI